MADPSGDDTEGSRRKGRHGTRLKQLTLNRDAGHRIPVGFDDRWRPVGPNRQRFNSYVALLGRSKASILLNEWDEVEMRVKDQIWESITVYN